MARSAGGRAPPAPEPPKRKQKGEHKPKKQQDPSFRRRRRRQQEFEMRSIKFGSSILAAIAAVLTVSNVLAANGSIARGETKDLAGNVTVSGDIETADGSKKFYDGMGTPTVVFFCSPTAIKAPHGASWVSLDETRPEVVAARNNAQLQTYPTGCQVPATLAGTIGAATVAAPAPIMAAPVVVPVALAPAPVQAAVTVNVTTNVSQGGCPAFRPGSLSPQVVLAKANNADGYTIVCGSIISVPGVLYGVDYPLPSSNRPVNVPAGYTVDGDVIVHGVPQYSGGELGEQMTVMNIFPRGGRVIAGYGANMMPGGADAFATSIRRCQAKFAEGSKTLCAIVDPEPEADQVQ